jgi:hypothetical protein
MPTPPVSDARTPSARRDLWLSALVCLGPLLWFASLGALYALSTHECGTQVPTRSWLLWSLASAACALVTLLSWRERRHAAGQAPDTSATKAKRVRFMQEAALGLNALCLVLLLGFVVPLLGLRPCD